MEDKHIQFFLNGKDYDLILRVDDEGEEYTSFDIFDYEKQETVVTEKYKQERAVSRPFQFYIEFSKVN